MNHTGRKPAAPTNPLIKPLIQKVCCRSRNRLGTSMLVEFEGAMVLKGNSRFASVDPDAGWKFFA
jgi:hypothetical protein